MHRLQVCSPRLVLAASVLFVCSTLFGWSTARSADAAGPLDEEGRLVQFERDIAPILRARCLECHGPVDAKNDFRVDDPESFLIYVEPGEAEFSTVFADYLTTDDEFMMMPPKSHGGPLTPAELALIRVWINEGAHWPEGFQLAEAPAAVVQKTEEILVPRSLVGRIWTFQGFFHPATVHFPIALLLIGALFVVLGWKWPVLGTQVPMVCLILGAAFAVVSTVMGWSFAVQQGYGGWDRVDFDSEIFWHRWSATIVAVLATIFAVLAVISVRRDKPILNGIWKTGLLVVAVIVGLVGHQGGELTYGTDFYPRAIRILRGQPHTPLDSAGLEASNEPAAEATEVKASGDG